MLMSPDYPQANIRLSFMAAALWMFSQPAVANGTIMAPPISQLSAEFVRLDLNHDGRLSREEASHDNDFSSIFNEADRNHDGKLEEDEYVSKKSELQQARMKEFLEDSAVTAKVKAELLKDSGIKGFSISVETHRGVVILSGFVDTELQVRRASEIASGVRGVVSVKNSLILKG